MYFFIIFTLCILGLGLLVLVAIGKFPLNGYPVLMMPSLYLIFVINSLQLHSNLIGFKYIDESIFTFSSFVCLITFLAVIIGWCYIDILPNRKLYREEKINIYYPYNRLFLIGTICHLLSFIAELLIAHGRGGGLLDLYSNPHSFYSGSDNPFLFYLFFLTFVGTVPYLQCFFSNQKLPPNQKFIIIFVCLVQIIRALIVGQRSWIFNLIFIYVTIPFFCVNRLPKIRQVAYFLLPAAVLVIILPTIRGSIYLGSTDLHNLPELVYKGLSSATEGDTGSSITDAAGDTSRVSSEFILGAATMTAAWRKNSYTYGLSFYDFLINPIPREIWDEKPKDLGLQSQVNIINNNYPWKFNSGSASTGIAEMFLNFGFFSIPFWFIFGLIHRLVYNLALKPKNFYAQGMYVTLLWGSTFLLNQSIFQWGTSIINSMFFMTIFYAYARILKVKKNT